jgi:hypothetical protein
VRRVLNGAWCHAIKPDAVWGFFGLTFALVVPFWIAGEWIGRQLLPGLPAAAITFVCPGLAAVILVRARGGSSEHRAMMYAEYLELPLSL